MASNKSRRRTANTPPKQNTTLTDKPKNALLTPIQNKTIDDSRGNDATIVKTSSSPIKIHTAEELDKQAEALSSYEVNSVIDNRYILVKKLGSGGSSTVYKARDTYLEENDSNKVYVAIKLLTEAKDYQNAVMIMRREACKTRELHHPNIVRIYDYNFDNQICYIVMELLEGESLDALVRRVRPSGLAKKDALDILKNISSALQYAHDKGIIHSDLKPSNIFLTNDQQIKLLDFGVARKVRLDEFSSESTILPEDDFSGYTPAYASPKVIAGELATKKDDIYSLACILYEILTSKHPFDRLPANKAIQQKKTISKTKKLNLWQWRGLLNAISFEESKRPIRVDSFCNVVSKPIRYRAVAIAMFVMLASIGLYGFTEYNQWKSNKNIALENEVNFKNKVENLRDIKNQDLTIAITDILELPQPIQAELLTTHREYIVNTYLNKADNQVESSTSPNYQAAIASIEAAQSIYPDSYKLISTKTALSSTLESRKSTMVNSLDTGLREKIYERPDGIENLTQLYNELNRLSPEFVFLPSKESISTYETYTQTAIDNNMFDRIVISEQIGATFFETSTSYLALLNKGERYLSAVKRLDDYQKLSLTDTDAVFPRDAAEQFFGSGFSSLMKKANSAKTVEEVTSVDNESIQYLQAFPSDFELAIELKSTLSSAYLRIGSDLLAKRYNRSARKLLARAKELDNQANAGL